MPNSKVSVLMSVYNGEKYLCEAIDSVLNQTFEDFEFIIVNDGSVDKTNEILNSYRDRRINLIDNKENAGLSKSLNTGLSRARGEYIARMDADDISLPERFKRQIDFLDKNPSIGLLGTSVEFIKMENVAKGIYRPPLHHDEIKAYLLINNCLWHPTIMARRDVMQKVGGYNDSLQAAADYDIMVKIAKISKLRNLEDILLHYRCEDNYYTKVRRRQQLECAFETSLKTFQYSMKDIVIDREAYKRWWWQFHWLLAGRHEKWLFTIPKFERGDTKHIKYFRDLIERYPEGKHIWGAQLKAFEEQIMDYNSG